MAAIQHSPRKSKNNSRAGSIPASRTTGYHEHRNAKGPNRGDGEIGKRLNGGNYYGSSPALPTMAEVPSLFVVCPGVL